MTQLTLAQLAALNRHGTRPRRILSGGRWAFTEALLFIRNAKIVFRNPLIRRRVPVGLCNLSREITRVRFGIVQAGDVPQQILKIFADGAGVFALDGAGRSIGGALYGGARRAGSDAPLCGVGLHQVCGYSI